jgi:hypothetical protein
VLTRILPIAVLASFALSACGGGGSDSSGTTASGSTASASAPATATAAANATLDPAVAAAASAAAADQASPAAASSGITVTGTGMKGGCDALNKLFLALDAGDKNKAQAYRAKAEALFNAVAANAAKDLKPAIDGASLAAGLEEFEPDKATYHDQLAPDYTSICVTKYHAPTLG